MLTREQFTYFNEWHHVTVRALVDIISIDEHADFDKCGKLLVPPPGAKLKESLQVLRLTTASRSTCRVVASLAH